MSMDFDALFDAAPKATPLRLTLFGREWELPGDPPASAILFQQRVQALAARAASAGGFAGLAGLSDDDELPPEMGALVEMDASEFVADLVGADNLAAWHERRITHEQLVHVIAWVQQQHALKGVGSAPPLTGSG